MSENQQRAHDLFFNTNLGQQQIAEILGVNRKTLYTWINQGKWIRARCAGNQAPVVLAGQYYAQLAALNEKIEQREDPFPTKEEAEIQRKLTNTLNNIRNDKFTMGETIQVFAVFIDKLKKKDLELTKKVLVYMDEHIESLTEEGRFQRRGALLREERELEKEYDEWVRNNGDADENPLPGADTGGVPPGGIQPVNPQPPAQLQAA